MARSIEKFREMNANELDIQQRELSEQIFRLRFQLASGQAEGLKKMREARKDLARVKTLLRAKQMQAQPEKKA
jgi:large subunit ribosomal protein L29